MQGYDVTEPRLRGVLPFKAVPAEVGQLRRAARSQLREWGVLAAADETELLVSELATNVVKHVGEGTSATLILEWRGERLRVEVHDKGGALPELKPATRDDECGRGLHLLAAIAVDWGTIVSAVGRAVWCEIALGAGTSCRRIERAVEALESYQGGRGGKQERTREGGLEESAIELIADLLHWTAGRGQDPDGILDKAQTHYEAEAGAA
ncbi:ATP-binding protein [Streptomyces sp. NPDC000345]|uniref:ATP-binding protein n=1 Tax=Streptomyces sp. NPDC000345 TaxID=3364537 RepID=UPI0036A00101